jgi:hypothetical protein
VYAGPHFSSQLVEGKVFNASGKLVHGMDGNVMVSDVHSSHNVFKNSNNQRRWCTAYVTRTRSLGCKVSSVLRDGARV